MFLVPTVALLYVALAATVVAGQPPTVADFVGRVGNNTAEAIISYNNGVYFSAVLCCGVTTFETPAQVHFVTYLTAAMWEPHAACHPKALGFFGDRVPIAPGLCEPATKHALVALVVQRVMRRLGRPNEAAAVSNLLAALGVASDDYDTTDVSTAQGWANVRGCRLATYFENDGWDVLGKRTRADNRMPYADMTGYTPVNAPRGPPRRPLRWTPLVVPDGTGGRFFAQEHVLPHIGWVASPLTMTKAALHARDVQGPYAAPNADTMDAEDEQAVVQGLRGLLALQRNLTRQQRYEAAFWEDKLSSLGAFAVFYQPILGLDEFALLRVGLGELLARHDATLAAWRAKRATDLVRPSTLMRRLLGGTRARAYVRAGVVKEIDLADWEPLLAAQPHSEFPSGSAALCRASLDHMRLLGEEFTGGEPLPPFALDLSSFAARAGLEGPFSVNFTTMEAAYRNCGESRLWAGVHFPPAVEAGYQVVEDFGRMAYEHARDLANGKKPEMCERCV